MALEQLIPIAVMFAVGVRTAQQLVGGASERVFGGDLRSVWICVLYVNERRP